MKSHPIIGVAGYMGSGKSTLVQIWKDQFGMIVLDADRIARDLMISSEEIVRSIADQFDVVAEGRIDFTALGKIVFADSAQLKRLNAIVHPPLIKRINVLAEESSLPVIVDCALLTLWRDQIKTDRSLWIDAPQALRIDRLQKRTGLSVEECEIRCRRQEQLVSAPEKSDHWISISNDSTIDDAVRIGSSVISTMLCCNS